MDDIIDKWLSKTFGDKKERKEHVAKHNSEPQKQLHKEERRHESRSFHDHKKHGGEQKNPHQQNQQITNKQNNMQREEKRERPLFKNQKIKKGVLRIIPMGGLNEVGQNMMIFEYENDIILVDMGFMFPDDDMLGIDYVVPDTTYLEERRKNIRAVIITHGHLDHIGGIPYMIEKLGYPPMYGTRLTMGLVENRLEEFKMVKNVKLNVINPNDQLRFGAFKVDFFRVNHSIPDGVGVYLQTPAGNAVHTGDFKFDETPADGIAAQIDKMMAIGRNGVDVLLSDSTNALKPGHTVSEMVIGETLDEIMGSTHSRILIASFSSLIGRIGQVLQSAKKYDRKVFISGRSMLQNIELAAKLGYLKLPEGLIHPIKNVNDVPDKNCLVLTTGAQGEPMSALTRISLGTHADIQIKKGDKVIVSASPIPGNERATFTVINNLAKAGAQVIHHKIMDVHVSGHGQKEDLRRMIQYIKPGYLAPIHGEFFMRQAHGEILIEEGYGRDKVILAENGGIIEVIKDHRTGKSAAQLVKETIPSKYILIDGLGMGSSDHAIISDRRHMAENGVMMPLITIHMKSRKIKGEIDMVSRGFIYMDESKEIMQRLREYTAKAYNEMMRKNPHAKRSEIKSYIRQKLDKHVHRLIARRPLIIPIIIEA